MDDQPTTLSDVIRLIQEVLPEHYDDPEFRNHFRELVGGDVQRIDEAVTRLQGIVDMGEVKLQEVNVTVLLGGCIP